MEFTLCYPGFHRKAFTFGYDDGILQDVQVISILRRHGMKGTFHLIPGLSGTPKTRIDRDGKEIDCSYLDLSRFSSLYDGMEVSLHTFSHPHLEDLPLDRQEEEIGKGKEILSSWFHREIYGFAYPYGTYDSTTLSLLSEGGIEYARTTRSSYDFVLPYRWHLWNPTVHHRDPRIHEMLDGFSKSSRELALLYIWGHGYEFALDHDFVLLEDICSRLEKEDAICLTNHEVYVYVNAAAGLYYSKRDKRFVNPSGVDIYLLVGTDRIIVSRKGVYPYENQQQSRRSR